MLDERAALELLRQADEAAKPVIRWWKLVVKTDEAFLFQNTEAPCGELRATVNRKDGSIKYSGTYRGHRLE